MRFRLLTTRGGSTSRQDSRSRPNVSFPPDLEANSASTFHSGLKQLRWFLVFFFSWDAEVWKLGWRQQHKKCDSGQLEEWRVTPPKTALQLLLLLTNPRSDRWVTEIIHCTCPLLILMIPESDGHDCFPADKAGGSQRRLKSLGHLTEFRCEAHVSMVAFIFSAMTFTMHVSRHHAFACYTPFCLTTEGGGGAGAVLRFNMSLIQQ